MDKKDNELIELRIEDAVSFFDNAKSLLSQYYELYSNEENDDKESKLKLIGDIFENLLKYIILVHQYKDFNKQLTKYLYDSTILEELLEKNIIDKKIFEDLSKYREGEYEDFNLTKYAYLYKLVDLLFYENTFDIIYKTLKNQIAFSLGKKKYLNNSEINDYDKFMLITNSFNKVNLAILLDEEGKSEYKSLVSEVKNKRVGIQDKYRMFVGNLSNTKTNINNYEVNDIFILVEILYIYCKYVYDNDNDYNFNFVETFYWNNVKKMCKLINRTEKEIEEIMSISKYKTDTLLSSYLFQSNLSVDDLKEYIKIEELDDDKLKFMFLNNVSINTFNKLKEKGFSIEAIVKIIKTNGNDYDNYKVDNSRIELLPYMEVSLINSLSSEEENYYLSKLKELQKLFDNKNYEEYFSAFVQIHYMEEIKGFDEALDYLDFEQLKIYDNIDKYLRKNKKLTSEDIIQNVKENLKMFEDNTDVLRKIPIMLSALNNKEILTALSENGLNIDKIDDIDGTIFCYSQRYVLKVINILKLKEVDIIIDNKINPNIIRYVTQLIHKETTNSLAPIIIFRPNKIKNNME